jgi:hypothetical protein
MPKNLVFGSGDQKTLWQKRFEGDRVRQTLTIFGMVKDVGHLLANHEQEYGTRQLTFDGFREAFPTFPVVLAATWIPRIAERCRPAELFRKFGDSVLAERYLEAYARLHEEADGRPIVLVVPFDGYRGGVVIHNGAMDTRGTRLIHDITGDRPPYRISAEPYDCFLTCLARGGWPSNPESSAQSARSARVSRTMSLSAGMVKRLGSGPALVVISWLDTVMASAAALDRRHVRRADNGERLVAATQEDIARETGLGLDAVKRGLVRLRREGLITTVRFRRRSHIWMQDPNGFQVSD